MPSDISGDSRRSHRAKVSTIKALPRPLRYALVATVLAIALVASVSMANLTGQASSVSQDSVADAVDLSGRDDVWAQVSRSDDGRDPLAEGGELVDFVVNVDGQDVELSSNAPTLAQALIDAGIAVDLDDVVSAPMGEPPVAGANITVIRVGTQVEVEVTEVAFETQEQRTSTLASGTRQVQTAGVPGSIVTTYERTYSDGEVVTESQITSVVASQPVTEVVLIGTGSASRPSSTGGSSGGGTGGSGTYTGGDPRAIARSMLASYGWGDDQWSCLNSLWQRESNWNPYAQNPSSGAYGIPQSLPASKMASAGSDWRTNPATQIRWGLGYIQGRYGSPCGAWSHSEARGWY
ncbi:MAG: G5 domain-containing protein [Beutenbergiaceae bacterium]